MSRRRGSKRRPATTSSGKKPAANIQSTSVSKATPGGSSVQASARDRDRAPAADAGAAGANAKATSRGDRPLKPRRWVPWFMAGASYAGFVISLYLTYVHYRGYVSPCYVVHGCEQVQTSRFSTIGPVPLALLGTIFFGLMFYLAIGLLTRSNVTLVRTYKVLAYLAALVVIPLFLIQAIWLRAFCSYCVATEAIMLSMWIVSFMLTTTEQRREPAPAVAPAGH